MLYERSYGARYKDSEIDMTIHQLSKSLGRIQHGYSFMYIYLYMERDFMSEINFPENMRANYLMIPLEISLH